ncbi:MAG: nucleotidyltransferase family protein [Acidaminococcus sp.]|uniref:tRNA(Met) cytidine acetate ligase n=1 Tax=Acidaminococcus sp. TaxID=1872103 RepID=UPI003F1397A3
MDFTSVAGIVAEYNPFHRGHGHQLAEIRRTLGPVPVVAVMSGSLTQRGELPLWDKWQRTALALAGGVDLVLELPVTGSLQSAQGFARAGVSCLAATGVVTHLSFGCETRDPALLLRLAREQFSPEEWRQALGQGLSYARASEALASRRDPAYQALFTGSNNLLALEYLKALEAYPGLTPLPIHRSGTAYGEAALEKDRLPSATALRREIREHGLTEAACRGLMEAEVPLCRQYLSQRRAGYDESRLDALVSWTLETGTPEAFAARTQVSEGLEALIWKNRRAGSFQTLVEACTTRRYPASRIRRLLWQWLLSSETAPFTAAARESPRYLRVLGFSETGRVLLRTMKQRAKLPVLTGIQKDTLSKAPDEAFRQQLTLDLRAQDLYDLLTEGKITGRDYKNKPVMAPCPPERGKGPACG